MSSPRLPGYAGVARAPFLALPVVLIANGALAQAYSGAFSLTHTLLALIGLIAVHVVVNVRNEVSDFRRGIDLVTQRTPFSGGSGTLPAGRLSSREAAAFGWIALVVGAVIGAYFIAVVGRVMVPILLAGLVMVLFYTPFFASIGVGELAAGAGLGFLPVLGAAVAQAGWAGHAAIPAGIPAFFMTFNLLLLNEFPDEQADRAGGRRNLVLLLGRRGAARVWLAAVLGEALSIGLGVAFGALPIWCLLALLPLVALAPAIRWAIQSPEAPVPIPALGSNVIWNLATNALLAVGFGVAMAVG